MPNYTSIGYTKKLYGTKGGVRITIKERYQEALFQATFVFVEMEGNKIPFFIKKIIESPPIRILFEDHLDRATAQKLTGKELFLPEEQVQAVPEASVDLTALVGFTIHDTNQGAIGPITSIEEFPQQLMAIVTYQEKEILIPLHEDLIDQINMDSQMIFVHLPEGLLDLFIR